MKLNRPLHTKQQGMAIIMALVFLLVLTVLGINATNTTILSEKMSQNMKDTTSAFQSAETALGDGELWVQSLSAPPIATASCETSPCRVVWASNTLTSPHTQPTSWWQTNAQPYSSTINNAAIQPMYLVELYAFIPYDLSPNALASGQGYYYYRITARGIGLTSNTAVNVQSIFATQF